MSTVKIWELPVLKCEHLGWILIYSPSIFVPGLKLQKKNKILNQINGTKEFSGYILEIGNLVGYFMNWNINFLKKMGLSTKQLLD